MRPENIDLDDWLFKYARMTWIILNGQRPRQCLDGDVDWWASILRARSRQGAADGPTVTAIMGIFILVHEGVSETVGLLQSFSTQGILPSVNGIIVRQLAKSGEEEFFETAIVATGVSLELSKLSETGSSSTSTTRISHSGRLGHPCIPPSSGSALKEGLEVDATRKSHISPPVQNSIEVRKTPSRNLTRGEKPP